MRVQINHGVVRRWYPAAWAAAAAIIAAIVFAPPAFAVTGATAGAPIEWGGRSFSASTDLAEWLRARGAAYETWAQRHPAAAARLEGEEPVEALGTTDQLEDSVADADDRPMPDSSSSTRGKVALALFVLALSLMLVPAVPRSIFARAQAEAVWNRRLDLATIGFAVAVGLAIVLIF